jgi:hypothetical protein
LRILINPKEEPLEPDLSLCCASLLLKEESESSENKPALRCCVADDFLLGSLKPHRVTVELDGMRLGVLVEGGVGFEASLWGRKVSPPGLYI